MLEMIQLHCMGYKKHIMLDQRYCDYYKNMWVKLVIELHIIVKICTIMPTLFYTQIMYDIITEIAYSALFDGSFEKSKTLHA